MVKLLAILIFFAVVGVYIPEPVQGLLYVRPPSAPVQKEKVTQQATLLFVGDLLYDRTIRREADSRGDDFIFSCIVDELRAHDIVVANLESPITHRDSVSLGSEVGDPDNFRFTSPLRTAEVLARHNIRLVSIGNNHINDFGSEGVAETRAALDAAGIAYAGDPRDAENMSARLEVRGAPIVLVAFNEFYGFTVADTVAHIQERNDDGFIIVFAHWGDEYATTSAPRQRTWARQFAEAGADLIVGAHPHVVQESEMYKNVLIYYSLGNFLFDQYMNEDVTTGLVLTITIGEDGIMSREERVVYIGRDRRPCLH